MKITPIPFDPKVLSLSVERDALRSRGIHLSTILKDRLITAGIERKVTGGKPFSPEEQHLLFQKGFLWERMVAEFLQTDEWMRRQMDASASKHLTEAVLEVRSDLVRPGECIKDGIYMTPDALDMKNYWIEEWKATAMRAKGFDIRERRIEWVWQACAYAATQGMNKAVFRIWHINDCVVNCMLLEWSHEEVEDNWAQIMEHYQFMRSRDGQIQTGQRYTLD